MSWPQSIRNIETSVNNTTALLPRQSFTYCSSLLLICITCTPKLVQCHLYTYSTVTHGYMILFHTFWEMNLCSEKIPIRYCQLQARLLLLVWKEWYSSRSLSGGEGNCHERRMHGTRPSFYGNKRNLKEVLGVEKGVERERRRAGYIGMWMFLEIDDHERGVYVNLGLPYGSQCYLFINYTYGTTALLAAVGDSIHIQITYQTICSDLIWSYLPTCSESYVLCYNLFLCSTEAMLCCVKRQGFKYLLRYLQASTLCTTSMHGHTLRPSPTKLQCSSCHSQHLQAACKQNFLKAKK